MNILEQLYRNKVAGKKSFAMLIDPDKADLQRLPELAMIAKESRLDYFFVGGSLLVNGSMGKTVAAIKSIADIPVVLFPGSPLQITGDADAVLLLSLISGRNPELLIGHHVVAAPHIRETGMEVIPTGYMLIDSGKRTSVHYMSHTEPIPGDKPEIAAATAMAGEMLGLKVIYIDAGSGAENKVTEEMISAVAKAVNVPVIVGGGIRSAEDAQCALEAGADLIVVGNALETKTNGTLVKEIAGKVSHF